MQNTAFLPIVLLHNMIRYWHRSAVRLSVRPYVCLSITLYIVALRVGVQG